MFFLLFVFQNNCLILFFLFQIENFKTIVVGNHTAGPEKLRWGQQVAKAEKMLMQDLKSHKRFLEFIGKPSDTTEVEKETAFQRTTILKMVQENMAALAKGLGV